LTHAPFFSLSSLKEERAGVRRPILQAHEPLAPALSPFGGERELFSFGAGIKMHPPRKLSGLPAARGCVKTHFSTVPSHLLDSPKFAISKM